MYSAGRLPVRAAGRQRRAPDPRHRRARLARVRRSGGPPAGGRPRERSDPELEQPPGGGVRRRGRLVLVGVGAAGAAPRARDRVEAAAHARLDGRRDERRRHPGSPRRRRLAARARRARDRAGALCAGDAGRGGRHRLERLGVEPPRPRARREDRQPGRGGPRRRLAAGSRTPCSRPCWDRSRAGSRSSRRATTGPRPTAARTGRGGTATSSRTSARCSAGRRPPATPAPTAAAAISRRAARRCGPRSTQPAAELAAAQGPDVAAWRSDATRERIAFGFLPDTARWTNRPTFQQVMSFSGHRPGR